jgi:WD40 repeat protein
VLIVKTFKSNGTNGRITDEMTSECIRQFYPENFKESHLKSKYNGISVTGITIQNSIIHVSAIDFNAKSEILVNYSQDDVYLFDSTQNKEVVTEFKQVYKGRRNVQTFLKEATFFGNDEYVVTGSDCGNVYIWEKNSANLVHCFSGDARVVNGIAPHPCHLPILAVCGIDSDAKIFEPSSESTVDKAFMEKMTQRNGEQPSEMRGVIPNYITPFNFKISWTF